MQRGGVAQGGVVAVAGLSIALLLFLVVGGQGGVKDLTGGTLAGNKKWTFRVR